MRQISQSRRSLAIALALCFVICIRPAGALIVAIDDQASLIFRRQDVPQSVETGSFACFLWLRPEQVHDVRRRVISLPPGVRITLEAGSGAKAETLGRGPGLDATADIALEAGRWALVAVSLDRAANRLDIWAGSEGRALAHGFAQRIVPGPALAKAEPLEPEPDDPWAIGAWDGAPGVSGAFGLVVIRSHAIGDRDAREVWESRRYFGPMDHDNRLSGGRMTGWQGAAWMTGHAITTGPIDGGVGGVPEEQVALVGDPVTKRNLSIVNRPAEPVGPSWSAYRTVRPIESVSGFRHDSRLLGEYGGFFRRDVPAASIPAWPAPAAAPQARQLVTGPTRPLRIMASANSRGMRSIQSDRWAQNYAHGFVQTHLENVSGVMLRPLSLVGNAGPWLGFDTKGGSPPTEDVRRVDRSVGADSDFSRFFTAAGGGGRGPGGAVRIFPGGFQAMRCRPVEGSLILADAPLSCEAHVLSFPGASDLLWRSDRAASQTAEGLLGEERRLELDTTRASRTLASPDRVIDDRTLALAGDWRSAILVGDAGFISAGPGDGAVSVVAEIKFDGAETVVEFEHPFGGLPQIGSTALFGRWSIRTVRHDFGPVAAGDSRTWRGIRMGAADDGRAGVIALGVSAYREDTPGFIFGAAGWGGHGYDPQLDESFRQAPAAWMAESRTDVWLVGFAQQSSSPGSMLRFTEGIRAALPEADVVWMGESEHGNSTFETWHRYVLSEGPTHGIPALSLLLEERIGMFLEQLADGMRADVAHYSAFGNRVLAELWTEQLAAATGGCYADCDESGEVDFFDFLCFQDEFAAGTAYADCDHSGEHDFFDLLCYQNAFAAGCR